MSLTVEAFLQMTAIFILLGWALYLPFRSGVLYNGTVYCMSISAYTVALLTIHLAVPFGAALLIGMGAGALAGLIPAYKLAKVSGFAMVIATIAIVMVVEQVMKNVPGLGGVTGLFGIPTVDYILPLSWVSVVAIGLFVYRIEHSRLGRAMDAMNTNGVMASRLGIDTVRLSVFLQVTSGILSGLAGVYYAFSMRVIKPADFSFTVLLYCWTMLFVGGYQTMWGVVVGAPLLWAVTQLLPSEVAPFTRIIFGIMLMCTLLLRPEGILNRDLLRHLNTAFSRLRNRLRRERNHF